MKSLLQNRLLKMQRNLINSKKFRNRRNKKKLNKSILGNLNDVPNEILSEKILPHLDLVSLFNFSLVNKKMNNIIKNDTTKHQAIINIEQKLGGTYSELLKSMLENHRQKKEELSKLEKSIAYKYKSYIDGSPYSYDSKISEERDTDFIGGWIGNIVALLTIPGVAVPLYVCMEDSDFLLRVVFSSLAGVTAAGINYACGTFFAETCFNRVKYVNNKVKILKEELEDRGTLILMNK